MLTYEEIKKRLFSYADEGYRAFHKKLLKNNAVNVIGVRTPVLRSLTKEWKGEIKALLSFPDEYYEVTFLKCAVAGRLPYGEFVAVVDNLVPLIDNWATCDCFNPRCIRAHREEFLPFLRKYLSDEREFVKRFGLVTLLQNYVDEEYLPLIFQSVKECGANLYYVMMAAAWLVAEVLVKFYEAGEAFLRECALPKEIHNTAIRKARESFRLSDRQKERLKAMRM